MIKRMDHKDIPAIKKVYSEAFDSSELIIACYKQFDEYIDFCIDQGYAFAAFNESDEMIGFTIGFEVPDMMLGKSLYIEILAVIPEEQGKGYGKSLISEMESAAKENGLHEISLRTHCYSDAYLIYRHIGFIDQRSDSRFLTKMVK